MKPKKHIPKPPKLADAFLESYCNETLLEELQGDLYEKYLLDIKKKSKLKADLSYWMNVIRLMNKYTLKRNNTAPSNMKTESSTYLNYLKVAYRNLLKYKVYALINIVGLAVGLASCLLIYLYIDHESNFDTFHDNADDIYQIGINTTSDKNPESKTSVFISAIGVDANEQFPEIENNVRISYPSDIIISYKNVNHSVAYTSYADNSLLDIFSFPLIYGNQKDCLSQPNSIILSASTSKRIFKDENPVGKSVKINGKENYVVNAVMEDIPENSHLRFDCIISFKTLEQQQDVYLGWNGGNSYYSYLKLKKGVNPDVLLAKFPSLLDEKINKSLKQYGIKYTAYLTPLKDIHLYSPSKDDMVASANTTKLIVFSIIAIFILAIAVINFINITTTNATTRMKEVGVRKTLGASRNNLVLQFYVEFLLTIMISFALAVIMVELALPYYASFLNTQIYFLSALSIQQVMIYVGFVSILGLVTGLYPAIYMSRLSPIKSLKPNNKSQGNGFVKYLVILQFAISITLIICTLTIKSQLNYLQHKNLGFDKENVLSIPMINDHVASKYELLKQVFISHSAVKELSAVSELPVNGITSNGYKLEGSNHAEMINILDTDEQFLRTMNIALVQGENLPSSKHNSNNYLINEAFVNHYGWDNPIGKVITRDGKHKVIGVIKDFNFSSLHEKVKPLIVSNRPWNGLYEHILLRIDGENMLSTLSDLENDWNIIIGDSPFEVSFLEDKLNDVYQAELRFETLFFIFSSIAIILGLSGLYSLVAFSIEKRKKEIAVRKVFGASVNSIIRMLSSQFLSTVFIANLIAIPIAYLAMQRWLDNFAYRIGFEVENYLFAVVFTLTISFLAILYHTNKAAVAKPSSTLQDE